MRAKRGFPCHQCAPEEWRRTPDLTGSYELDAVILPNPNRDMAQRLEYYLDCGDNVYSARTGYNGYHNYSGDS